MTGGTYEPFEGVARNNGFSIPQGISIYGGFAGHESSVNERIYGDFPTILSGDIGSIGEMSDNLYHVVTIAPGIDGVLLDGITIRNGLANGVTPDLQTGSGIFNLGRLTVRQVIIHQCSPPSLYNSPGSVLEASNTFNIKE
jgi:hypothetical protein